MSDMQHAYPTEIARIMISQDHGFSDALVNEVQALIDDEVAGRKGPITVMMKIREIFDREHIARDEHFSPEDVLCHPSNRGSLGLNGYTAHKNGAYIMAVGVNKQELDKSAVSIGMNPNPQVRDWQLAYNDKLISRGDGLFAPRTGRECRLSLGAGHAAAWWRASMHGCKTQEPSLQDRNGCLSRTFLQQKDDQFEVCCKGWTHYSLPYTVEIAWPRLCDVWQRACNASQNVAERQTDLECACTIAGYAAMSGSDEPDWDACVAAAAQGKPPCALYIDVVGRFAKSMGTSAIKWLDNHAKRFAADIRLGEEFITFIADTELHPVHYFAKCRMAFCAAQLLAKKQQDGVAKCLRKSDFTRLHNKDKANHALAVAAEDAMVKGWDFVSSVENVTEDQRTDLYGRFLLRFAFFLSNRQKENPFESKEFKTVNEICQLLLDEVVQDVESNGRSRLLVISPWATISASAKQAPSSAVAASSTEVAAVSRPVSMTSKHGFVIDKFVIEKNVPNGAIWKVTNVGDDGVITITQHVICGPAPMVARVTAEVAIKQWQLFKGDPPALIPKTWPEKHNALVVASGNSDERRCRLFVALREHERTLHEHSFVLRFSVRPSNVFAGRQFKKGELVFVPTVTLANITDTHDVAHHRADVDKEPMYIKRQVQPQIEDLTKWKKDLSLVPFFWVRDTDQSELANMDMKQACIGNISFPTLVNVKPLKVDDKLLIYKPKQVVRPLKGATLVSEPKAKARKLS